MLWESVQQRIISDNRIEEEKLKARILVPNVKMNISEAEIMNIKDKLYWSTILKLFIEGHKDKTQGIFEYYNITG